MNLLPILALILAQATLANFSALERRHIHLKSGAVLHDEFERYDGGYLIRFKGGTLRVSDIDVASISYDPPVSVTTSWANLSILGYSVNLYRWSGSPPGFLRPHVPRISEWTPPLSDDPPLPRADGPFARSVFDEQFPWGRHLVNAGIGVFFLASLLWLTRSRAAQ